MCIHSLIQWPVNARPPTVDDSPSCLTFGLMLDHLLANQQPDRGPSADTPEVVNYRLFKMLISLSLHPCFRSSMGCWIDMTIGATTGQDPTNFWESNMDPRNIVCRSLGVSVMSLFVWTRSLDFHHLDCVHATCNDVIFHYFLNPTIFSVPAALLFVTAVRQKLDYLICHHHIGQ